MRPDVLNQMVAELDAGVATEDLNDRLRLADDGNSHDGTDFVFRCFTCSGTGRVAEVRYVGYHWCVAGLTPATTRTVQVAWACRSAFAPNGDSPMYVEIYLRYEYLRPSEGPQGARIIVQDEYNLTDDEFYRVMNEAEGD